MSGLMTPCPAGKERNPFYELHKQQVVDGDRLRVRKCLKVCPELYVRDPEFGRCKSTRPRGRPALRSSEKARRASVKRALGTLPGIERRGRPALSAAEKAKRAQARAYLKAVGQEY